MKLYELNYYLSQSLGDKEVQETALKVESLVQDKGGILVQERKKKPVKLSDPIKEESRVLLFTLKFQMEGNSLRELEKEFKTLDKVLRFMIEKKKRRTMKKQKRRGLRKILAARKTERKRSESKAKVELQKIEEKLDEILDESK